MLLYTLTCLENETLLALLLFVMSMDARLNNKDFFSAFFTGHFRERRPQPGQRVDCIACVGHNQGTARIQTLK